MFVSRLGLCIVYRVTVLALHAEFFGTGEYGRVTPRGFLYLRCRGGLQHGARVVRPSAVLWLLTRVGCPDSMLRLASATQIAAGARYLDSFSVRSSSESDRCPRQCRPSGCV
ncbi:hypothetical protein NDU88_001030 [Pleurodeles waltl]|uniref:Secreted protein n=1 Tax=Pleurodeles waltl TaxID=8319 RepID=A0AAV7LWF6_PLEWA|nr:hypothetical protein NDU88_001030 [Pleurodeles waltl]